MLDILHLYMTRGAILTEWKTHCIDEKHRKLCVFKVMSTGREWQWGAGVWTQLQDKPVKDHIIYQQGFSVTKFY